MENKPVTVEPVLCSDRQRDVSSNHAEIQVSRRRKAKDTVQFQSAEANHDHYDLEKSLQNLEVDEHVEVETTENNHDQREKSQNLHAHEINGQEIGATGGYSAFSRVQPEEADDLQLPEIQESQRRKAQDTVQFQSADANHDLENRLQNLEVVEHVEGETTENNHDQREESQNLHAHENSGQAISSETNQDLEKCTENPKVDNEEDAIGYSVQPENPDDLPDMLRDIIDTDGMFNTCTLDTFTTIMAIQQYQSDEIHNFFTLSEHAIYRANRLLPDLLRENRLSDMRRLIVDYSKCLPKISSAVIGDSLPKKSNQKNWAAEINDLIQIYVINEVFVFTHCDYCGHTRSVDVVNCMDLRPKDKNEGPNCLPDQMLKNPFNFFEIKLEHYLNNFFLHNNGIYGRTETCLECTCESTVVNKVKDSVGCPAPVFFVMIPIRGSGKSGKVLLEEAVKDIPPLCCFNFEYVLGAIIMFKYNPGDHLGHYVAHIYRIDPGSKTKYYRYCNSKGINPVEDFEEEGDCVTFLFFRTK